MLQVLKLQPNCNTTAEREIFVSRSTQLRNYA